MAATRDVEYRLHEFGFARDNPEGINSFGNISPPFDAQYFVVLKTPD